MWQLKWWSVMTVEFISTVQVQALNMAASLNTELQEIIAFAQIPDNFYWNDQYTGIIVKERKTKFCKPHCLIVKDQYRQEVRNPKRLKLCPSFKMEDLDIWQSNSWSKCLEALLCQKHSLERPLFRHSYASRTCWPIKHISIYVLPSLTH